MSGKGQVEQKHVLVVDAAFDASPNLLFLLKINNCQVSQARTIEEVINRVRIQILLDDPLDLLVINSFPFSPRPLPLFTESDLLFLKLPVLIINRGEETAKIEPLLRGLGLNCPITVSDPVSLNDTLVQLL